MMNHDAAEVDWRAFFQNPEYLRFADAIVPPERTAAEVQELTKLLGLRPGTRLLDLGCGNGRLAVPLAVAGCSVTGLDASESLLAAGRKNAADAGADVSFIHADMKDLSITASFDVVINVGTAFGYVPAEEDDRAALRAARDALVPGGTLLMETENREHRVRASRRIWFEMADTVVWCDRSYDPRSGRWREHIQWLAGGHRYGAEYSMRLYTLTELTSMLHDAGLRLADVHGDLGGSPYDLDSPRLVVIAAKPED